MINPKKRPYLSDALNIIKMGFWCTFILLCVAALLEYSIRGLS